MEHLILDNISPFLLLLARLLYNLCLDCQFLEDLLNLFPGIALHIATLPIKADRGLNLHGGKLPLLVYFISHNYNGQRRAVGKKEISQS